MNILPVIYAHIKLWADLLCANTVLHYNWDHSFRVQQEQVGNPSINTKHSCPHVDNKALPNSPHVKYAHILHITQLYLICRVFIFAVGCWMTLHVLFICCGIENDEDWFGCQCPICAEIVLNARPSLTLCFWWKCLSALTINVLGSSDVTLSTVNFMENCILE